MADEQITKDQLKTMKKGRNAEQGKVVDYFFSPGGCGFPKPMSDGEYGNLVNNMMKQYKEKSYALSKIGMDEDQVSEITPVRFSGYEDNESLGASAFGSKLVDVGGAKKKYYSSVYSVTWLFFSNDQVLMYSVLKDMMSDAIKESTEEYFYKDITNFSTVNKTKSVRNFVKGGGCKGKGVKVEVTNTQTAAFQMSVFGEKFGCAMDGDETSEAVINGMKQKLREKKA